MSVDRLNAAGHLRPLIHGALVAFIGATGCFASADVFAAPSECTGLVCLMPIAGNTT